FGQTRDDTHDELQRGTLAVKDRAMGFREIVLAGDVLQLLSGLATGMFIGPVIAPAQPAMVGIIRFWIEVCVGVDSPSATSGITDDRWWEVWRLGLRSGCLFTGCAQRFVEEAREGFGLFHTSASTLMGLGGRCGRMRQIV